MSCVWGGLTSISGTRRPECVLVEWMTKEMNGGLPSGRTEALEVTFWGISFLPIPPLPPQMGKEHYFCIKTNMNILWHGIQNSCILDETGDIKEMLPLGGELFTLRHEVNPLSRASIPSNRRLPSSLQPQALQTMLCALEGWCVGKRGRGPRGKRGTGGQVKSRIYKC